MTQDLESSNRRPEAAGSCQGYGSDVFPSSDLQRLVFVFEWPAGFSGTSIGIDIGQTLRATSSDLASEFPAFLGIRCVWRDAVHDGRLSFCKLYEGDEKGGEQVPVDSELPGLWSASDFTGGEPPSRQGLAFQVPLDQMLCEALDSHLMAIIQEWFDSVALIVVHHSDTRPLDLEPAGLAFGSWKDIARALQAMPPKNKARAQEGDSIRSAAPRH